MKIIIYILLNSLLIISCSNSSKEIEYKIDDGIKYFNSGQIDSSLAYFKREITINPDELNNYYYMGLSYMSKRDYFKAIEYFTIIIDRNASFAKAYFKRGEAELLLGDVEDAINDLSVCLESDKQNGLAFYYRGVAYNILGLKYKANQDFRKAKKFGFNKNNKLMEI